MRIYQIGFKDGVAIFSDLVPIMSSALGMCAQAMGFCLTCLLGYKSCTIVTLTKER